MSLAELQQIQARQAEFCGPGGVVARPRAYVQAPLTPAGTIEHFVDPVAGTDPGFGAPAPAGTVFRTLTRALREIPYVAVGAAGTPLPRAYVITLRRNTDYWYADPADPARGEQTAPTATLPSDPSTTDNRHVEWWEDHQILAFEQRMGAYAAPVIIRGEGADSEYVDEYGDARSPDLRPRIHFRLELRGVQYLYLQNLRVLVDGTRPSGLHAVHVQTFRDMPGYLRTDHVLFRECEIDGGWRPGPAGVESSGEVLKANHCRSLFVERCEIHGAGAVNGNCIDLIQVRFGHVVECHLHQAADWCMYAKGGSAFIRVDGNRIHGDLAAGGGPRGFSVGEGTDCSSLEAPYWHAEAYAIQFVNNLVYDFPGAGVNVQGGHHVLIAHNTFFNVGAGLVGGQPQQAVALRFGNRNCHDMSATCGSRLAGDPARQAWVTTSGDDVSMVPNRFVYLLNNVILNDRTPPMGFNVFEIASPIGTPAELAARGSPGALYPDPASLPFPVLADQDLYVRGNVVSVLDSTGVRLTTAGETLIGSGYSGAVDFRTDFGTYNRLDATPPDLDRATPADAAAFLRPRAAIAAPPPGTVPPPVWGAGLPDLPVGEPTRDTPFPGIHDVYMDFDGICRGSGAFPGARLRVAVPQFYLRDWTETPATHDDGAEPSAREVFWTSSDVWNQLDAASVSIDPGTDQPVSAVPRPGSAGSNFAFARIHRVSAAGPQRVTARFLYADFGMGSAFRDLGDAPPPDVSFGTADGVRTVSYEWRLPDRTSSHVCLAAEISAPGDPLRSTLRGRAPGGTTDPLVRGDNNKAQRNIDLPLAAMSPGGGSGASTGSGSAMAIVRNPATLTRDVTVAYEVAKEARHRLHHLRVRVIDAYVPPRDGGGGSGWAALLRGVLRALLLPFTRVVRAIRRLLGGGEEPAAKPVPEGTLLLARMRPGESRWVEVEAGIRDGGGAPVPIHFREVRDGRTVNGFTVAVRPAAVEEAAGANLSREAAVLARYRAAGALDPGQLPGKEKGERIPAPEYLAALSSRLDVLAKAAEISRPLGDPFAARDALAGLRRAVRAGDAAGAAEAHARLLGRLDAAATALDKREGDPAEILHNVLWHSELARRVPALREGGTVERAEAFVRAWDARRAGEKEYAELLKGEMETLRRTAELGGQGTDLTGEVEALERSLGDPRRLQRAHRSLLLALDRVASKLPEPRVAGAEALSPVG